MFWGVVHVQYVPRGASVIRLRSFYVLCKSQQTSEATSGGRESPVQTGIDQKYHGAMGGREGGGQTCGQSRLY